MALTVQPLLDRYETLRPAVKRLRTVADPGDLETELMQLRTFLHHRLIPHAVAEELVLYPAMQWALNSSNPKLAVSRDHTESGSFS